MENKILIGIIVICGMGLLLGILRNRIELLLNIILRMVFGVIGIYLINFILISQGIIVEVGSNITTILSVGLLGVPGLLLIYGIELYSIFLVE